MVKNLPANAGDKGSVPGLGSSPEGGDGNPLQYSCLENPRDQGVWWAGSIESQRVRHDCALEEGKEETHLAMKVKTPSA